MAKKKKKRRLRVGRLFLLLIILGIICFLLYYFVDIPIKSITIKGNDNLTDQEVIEIAKLEDYPSFFGTLTLSIKNKLENNFYIRKATVTKGFFTIKIKIDEEDILYIDKNNMKYSMDGSKKDDKSLCVPYLINEVPKNKIKRFKKAMTKLNKNVLCKISEIKYYPNDIDKDRYLAYMDDGNEVYLTVNKFKKLNKYDTILESIGKQNGVLYLDYGDYFEAK
ncbi:MAG: FtsQ-type POTRA domain-containing protein [Tenericutes bacterium]|nr:FtsQ-type POTRA domain-containing protein [Mycoplasmatota bacterium]